MRKWVFLLAFVAMLWPGTASAQTPDANDDEGALIRINADVVIAEGESIDNLFVIRGNAVVDGTVTGSLLVIDGDATISGSVADDVTVISGDLFLLDGANVNNVHTIRGTLTRAPGATVTGNVDQSDFTGLGAVLGVLSILFWIGMTIAMLVAGIVFAFIGGRQLTAAATLMTGDAVKAVVGTVVLVIGLPILAVIAIVTVIGLPLGLGILLFLIPVLGFLGYLVAATRLGLALTSAMKREPARRPILAVVLGVLIFQIVLLIPAIGGLLVFLASMWGAGSLAYTAYRGAGGRDVVSEPAPPPAMPA